MFSGMTCNAAAAQTRLGPSRVSHGLAASAASLDAACAPDPAALRLLRARVCACLLDDACARRRVFRPTAEA